MEQRCYKIKYKVITFITACRREIYPAESNSFRCTTGAVKALTSTLWQKLTSCSQNAVSSFPCGTHRLYTVLVATQLSAGQCNEAAVMYAILGSPHKVLPLNSPWSSLLLIG